MCNGEGCSIAQSDRERQQPGAYAVELPGLGVGVEVSGVVDVRWIAENYFDQICMLIRSTPRAVLVGGCV